MPLAVNAVVGAGATGAAMGGVLPAGASNAIAAVTAGNMFGGHPATFVANVMGWRCDRQNPPANHVNVSIQRNNIGAPSTVASVFVPTALNIGPHAQAAVTLARQRELERVTRRGLELSLASRAANPLNPPGGTIITRYIVTGNYSA
jgi:hypothetical protein